MVPWAVFYVILFSLLAGLLVFAGITAMSRTRSQPPAAAHPSTGARRQRKAKRAQSRHDRRKRR